MENKKIELVAQLISAIEDTVKVLETSYNKKDLKDFKKAKSTIIDLQEKISKNLK